MAVLCVWNTVPQAHSVYSQQTLAWTTRLLPALCLLYTQAFGTALLLFTAFAASLPSIGLNIPARSRSLETMADAEEIFKVVRAAPADLHLPLFEQFWKLQAQVSCQRLGVPAVAVSSRTAPCLAPSTPFRSFLKRGMCCGRYQLPIQ